MWSAKYATQQKWYSKQVSRRVCQLLCPRANIAFVGGMSAEERDNDVAFTHFIRDKMIILYEYVFKMKGGLKALWNTFLGTFFKKH